MTTYAGTREILDADSHVMELPDFLDEFLAPELADRLRRDTLDAARPLLDNAVDRPADAGIVAAPHDRLVQLENERGVPAARLVPGLP